MATAQLAPGVFAPQEEEIRRRMKLAESLQTPTNSYEGKMVSGHYVGASPLEMLADVLRSKKGKEDMGVAQQDLQALAEKVRNKQNEDWAGVAGQMTGKPAQTMQPLTPNDDQGNVNPAINVDAQAPDIGGAYARALQAEDPTLRQFGMQGMMTNAENQAKLAQALQQRKAMSDMWTSSGGDAQKFMAIGGDPTFAKQMAEAPLMGKEKLVNVNGQMVGEHTGQAVGSIVPKQFDKPAAVTEYEYAKNQGYQGSLEQFMLSQKKAGASNVSVNTGQKGFDNTLKLRSDFRSEPIYKAHQEMQSAYSQIGAGLKANTPVGDLAAATKIMKLLDPGSVVRESELGMAMAATGLGDRLSSYATNVINGTKLTEKQRKDFQSLADQLYSTSIDQYNNKQSEYSNIANRNQLNVDDVVGSPSKLPQTKPMPDKSAFAAEMARRGLK